MNLAAITSLGQRVLNTARQGFSHLKESLSNLRSAEAGSDDSDLEVKEHLSEKGLSVHLLRVSVLAVAFKALHYFVNREWLVVLVSFLSSVLGAPVWLWTTMMSGLIPLACATVMATVTWFTVFLDRCIPGIYPPSPASEKKHLFPNLSTFHLGYIIALVNGFILSLLVYARCNNLLLG